MSALLHIMKRDLQLAVRRRGGVVHSVVFCLMLVVMYPLAFGADSTLLQTIGAGVIWVAALVISTLNLPTLFEDDFEDGSLEGMALTPTGLHKIICGKLLAHWLTGPVVLALASPFFAMLLGLGAASWVHLAASLSLGGLLLTLIGSLGAALSLGVRKAGMLLSLLVLPLYVPVLIFSMATLGATPEQGYMGLGFLLLVLLPVTLLASAQALKVALEEV